MAALEKRVYVDDSQKEDNSVSHLICTNCGNRLAEITSGAFKRHYRHVGNRFTKASCGRPQPVKSTGTPELRRQETEFKQEGAEAAGEKKQFKERLL